MAAATSKESELLDLSVEGLANYDVHEYLGSGVTSDVFRVTKKDKGRSYVMKQMSLENMTDEEQIRAKQEILVMDGVNHPNVVKFHESFHGERSVDIIMEYCEGGTLEDLIERQRYEGKPFPEDVIIEWMAELLCALAHIHSVGILHRDIKTSNIYSTAKYHLKLGDFGVCAVLSNANGGASDTLVGTPLYFAPEVCESQPYDERSDIWSLGVVFYEMCTLRRPFEGDNLFTLIQNILTKEVKPFNTGLAKNFETLVRKMLSKNPRERPTAQELIQKFLEVPANHPSHPSQKAARSRLLQQYAGPTLTFQKPWPPPKNAAVEPLGSNWNCTGSERDRFLELTMTTFGDKAIVGSAGKNPSNVKDTQKPKAEEKNDEVQALNRTTRTPKRTAPSSAPVSASAATAATATTTTKSSAKAAAAKASTKSPTGGARKTGSPPSACPSSNRLSVLSPLTSDDGGRVSRTSFCMSDLQKDVLRKQSALFGEANVLSAEETPVIVEVDNSFIDSSSIRSGTRPLSESFGISVSTPNTFLQDVVAAVERNTANGKPISLDELDDAVSYLSQYKILTYGIH